MYAYTQKLTDKTSILGHLLRFGSVHSLHYSVYSFTQVYSSLPKSGSGIVCISVSGLGAAIVAGQVIKFVYP